MLRSHEAVFHGGLGALEGYQARILVDPDATPRFSKAHSVPYAYWELVEKELDHLVSEGILEPVEFSEWASPIVPVLKSDNKSVRVCGGLSMEVEDLFTSLSGAKVFSKIDLSQAYQQVPFEEESRQ